MNILFFTKGDTSLGSSRYRVWFLAEKLQKKYGWKYEVVHSFRYSFFSFSKKRFELLRYAYAKLCRETYDILFIHKSFFPWDVVILFLIAYYFFRKKLVYDLDDAEWLHSPVKSWLIAKSADAVFCGSHEILVWAQKYNKNTVFVPTVLDADVYAAYPVSHADGIQTIGWVGQGKAHFKQGGLHIIKPALDALWKRGVQFRFVVIGSQKHEPLKSFFAGVPYSVFFVDEAEWEHPETVPALIQKYNFNVGVMPLVDNPFNRAKCAFKIIEYMASSVPAVASPVGENTVLIQHGENGFLAGSTEEWVSILEKLLAEKALRERIGKAGKKTVREKYSYEYVVPVIHNKLSSLLHALKSEYEDSGCNSA